MTKLKPSHNSSQILKEENFRRKVRKKKRTEYMFEKDKESCS